MHLLLRTELTAAGFAFVALTAVGLWSGCGVEDQSEPRDTHEGDGGTVGEPAACLVVGSAEFGAAGSVALVDISSGEVAVDVTSTHHDSVVRTVGGGVFVLNRLARDNVVRLDADRGFGVAWQRSLGRGSNPWDLVELPDGRGLVALYGDGTLQPVRIDSTLDAGFIAGPAIDLSPWADADGNAEPSALWRDGDTVYALLQRLTRHRCGLVPSAILAMDGDTLEADTAVLISLQLCNASSVVSLGDGVVAVGASGAFRSLGHDDDDGGVELVDLIEGVSLGRVVSESELGGRDVLVIRPSESDPTRLWAAVVDAELQTAVVALNDVQGTPSISEPIYTGMSVFDFVETGGAVWVADRDPRRPALVRVDLDGGDERRIETGHPPFSLAVVEGPSGCVP